jgi:hypothetical protein
MRQGPSQKDAASLTIGELPACFADLLKETGRHAIQFHENHILTGDRTEKATRRARVLTILAKVAHAAGVGLIGRRHVERNVAAYENGFVELSYRRQSTGS